MNSLKRLWFPLGLLTIFALSLGLRFWGLGRFNAFVFDEVYFVKFAQDYLTQKPFFDNHPPLGKYLIALGIWLSQFSPWSYGPETQVPDFPVSTLGFRWLNAFTGACIPLVVAAIAYELTQRRSYALIAGLLTASDGLLLVESRYGLINVYLIVFGLLGHWFLLRAIGKASGPDRTLGLAVAGIFFGASLSVKWNGLGFLIGVYTLWLLAMISQHLPRLFAPAQSTPLFQRFLSRRRSSTPENLIATLPETDLLSKFRRIQFLDVVCELGLLPLLVYRLVWIPHLAINPEFNFWQSQQESWYSHTHVGSGTQTHPYCSLWYSWPLLLRPIAYWYEKVEQPSLDLKFLPQTTQTPWIYDVHALGNPLLWWMSTIALIVVITVLAIYGYYKLEQGWNQLRMWLGHRVKPTDWGYPIEASELGILLYLLINHAMNWLPWVGVHRCLFLYHYMASSIFAFLILAWFIDYWLSSKETAIRFFAGVIVGSILIALVYWLPIYLGLPLTPEAFASRMWLRSWY